MNNLIAKFNSGAARNDDSGVKPAPGNSAPAPVPDPSIVKVDPKAAPAPAAPAPPVPAGAPAPPVPAGAPTTAAAPPPPGAGGGPPPPPPPPPPPKLADLQAASAGETGGSGALFAEINNLGEGGVRSGLKKATRGPVNESAPPPAAPAPVPAPVAAPKAAPAAPVTRPPKAALEGKKWVVEYFENDPEITININSIKESIYIYKCNKSTIQIKGKCNSIAIDSCKKFNCLFESALSTCEIVNSSDVAVQATGSAPAMTIDNCNTVTYYISQESLADAHIVTSKCAAVNLCAPKPDDPEDMFETPVPEQLLTTFKNGAWVTEFVDHSD